MRTRLIAAFILVALLSALASAWFGNLILPWYHLPAGLSDVISGPGLVIRLLYSPIPRVNGLPAGKYPAPPAALAFILVVAVVLLAVIAGAVYAASRRVLLPVRRLAGAAQRMSDGDLSVRIEPRGRDELARLVSSFNGMAAALEDKVGELQRLEARARQFAGDVSHELRTPLAAMTAVTDVLGENAGLTGDAAVAARLVRREVVHLNRLVDDLIEISRFDAGTARLVIDETDIAAAIGNCLRARGWENVRASAPVGLTAELDRRRFDVILANLVGNALGHGGSPVTVTAALQPDGQDGQGCQRLAVTVRDHGPGLPPASIPHVFDRFYKADTARARSEGSGLGLAIAGENARLHGGHIEAANHPDGGAVFTVVLPMSGSLPAGMTPEREPARL
jgi:two-component system, OmpR family, sensor histidine kinase MtrB